MATVDAHTRRVTFAKIVLPLIALAILSTLFLTSGEINPNDAIPYANIDVKEAAREQRLTNARYATVGTDGAVIEFSAAEARPDPNDPALVTATTVSGQVKLTDGVTVSLSAGGASVNSAKQIAGLTENVKVSTSDGYRITAPDLTVHMDRAQISSDGPVSAVTPFGTLDAGNMLLSRGTGKDAPYRLLFNNKVRLVYAPQK